MLDVSSCGTVKIKDVEWCSDLGPIGATCFTSLSHKARDVEKDAWDTERFGMLCVESSGQANWMAAILKLCRNNSSCDWEVVQKHVSYMESKLKTIETKAQHVRQEYDLAPARNEEVEYHSPLGCFGSDCPSHD